MAPNTLAMLCFSAEQMQARLRPRGHELQLVPRHGYRRCRHAAVDVHGEIQVCLRHRSSHRRFVRHRCQIGLTTWSDIIRPLMPGSRWLHCRRLEIFGGDNSGVGAPVSTIYRYTIATGTWCKALPTCQPQPAGPQRCSAYVIGGLTASGPVDSVNIYNPVSRQQRSTGAAAVINSAQVGCDRRLQCRGQRRWAR